MWRKDPRLQVYTHQCPRCGALYESVWSDCSDCRIALVTVAQFKKRKLFMDLKYGCGILVLLGVLAASVQYCVKHL